VDTLELLAELSIGLLGFSGVVSALGKSKLDIEVREFRVTALLTYSATAFVASLTPLLLASYNIATDALWMVAAALLLIVMPIGPVVTASKYVAILRGDPFLRRIGPPIMILLLIVWLYLAYVLFFGQEMLRATYTLGVMYLLTMGVFHFCMLRKAPNMQLKSVATLLRPKHLRSKCESHLNPRRLRRLTGCYTPRARS
jgi:hypothetical protein